MVSGKIAGKLKLFYLRDKLRSLLFNNYQSGILFHALFIVCIVLIIIIIVVAKRCKQVSNINNHILNIKCEWTTLLAVNFQHVKVDGSSASARLRDRVGL